jgi:hypothetical protein
MKRKKQFLTPIALFLVTVLIAVAHLKTFPEGISKF